MSVILMITGIGLPMGFGLLVLYMVECYLAKLVVSYYLGTKLLSTKSSQYLQLSLGVLAVVILTSIPIFAFFARLVIATFGLGALYQTYWPALTRKPSKSK